MRKNETKTSSTLCAAIQQLLDTIPEDRDNVQIDVREFREVYKLTSIPKRRLALMINDALRTNKFWIDACWTKTSDRWTLGEIEHPIYQMSRVDMLRPIVSIVRSNDNEVQISIKNNQNQVLTCRSFSKERSAQVVPPEQDEDADCGRPPSKPKVTPAVPVKRGKK